MPKALAYSLIPWTESVCGLTGYLLTIRTSADNRWGQAFFLTHEDATRAYTRAVQRLKSGEDPLEDSEAVYRPLRYPSTKES